MATTIDLAARLAVLAATLCSIEQQMAELRQAGITVIRVYVNAEGPSVLLNDRNAETALALLPGVTTVAYRGPDDLPHLRYEFRQIAGGVTWHGYCDEATARQLALVEVGA